MTGSPGRSTHRPPITVRPGDDLVIANSGSVFVSQADTFILRIFGVGNLAPWSDGAWPFSSPADGYDRPELFALPWPWHHPAPSPFGRPALPRC